jgi:hypothetical protein
VERQVAAPPFGEQGSKPEFPPLQVELRTPVEPIAVPSAGRTYLLYELHIRNFSRDALAIRRLDVVDAASRKPLATFANERFQALVRPGAPPPASSDDAGQDLAANESTVAFVCLAFDDAAVVPVSIGHRVYTADAAGDGPPVGTHRGDLRTLGPPVSGSNWVASSGPSNDSHHRVGLVVVDGTAQISRRYAIDWLQMDGGETFAGNERDNRSYLAYDEAVLAVGDGTIVAVTDGLPDNDPRTAAGFRTAVPMTRATIAGNHIAIDLGRGQFASYLHLRAGTLRVKVGDRVRRGQVIAHVGASGDARAPHLHFQVTTKPDPFASEGVPYVIDRYRVQAPDGTWVPRRDELPVSDMLIDFGPARR